MLLTVVICVDIDFCMIYGTKIGERCETVRTWFDRGVNRLHRLHRLFSCQQKLFCQRIARRTRSFLVNRLHRLHRLSSCQRKLLLSTESTKNTKFFSQQITLITQKIKFVLFVLSVGKRKNQCNLCNPLTKQKFVLFVLSVGKTKKSV